VQQRKLRFYILVSSDNGTNRPTSICRNYLGDFVFFGLGHNIRFVLLICWLRQARKWSVCSLSIAEFVSALIRQPLANDTGNSGFRPFNTVYAKLSAG